MKASEDGFQHVQGIVDSGIAPPAMHKIKKGHECEADQNQYRSRGPQQAGSGSRNSKRRSQAPSSEPTDEANLQYQHQGDRQRNSAGDLPLFSSHEGTTHVDSPLAEHTYLVDRQSLPET